MPNILIIEPSHADAEMLASAAKGVGAHKVEVLSAWPDSGDPTSRGDLVVFGPGAGLNGHAELARRLTRSGGAALLVAHDPDTALMRSAMQAGFSDCVSFETPAPELSEAFKSALSRLGMSHSVHTAHVITVFSTKGGVGKTVLSTNLACSLAASGKRVALVDLDLQFGDIGIMLGLPPERTITDVIASFERLDETLLEGALTDHTSGVRALLAPKAPEEAESVSASRANAVLSLLSTMVDVIVIDTAPAFNDITLAALDASDLIYVVTMMDVASIKNTRISMQKLAQLGYDSGTTRLVLNRADSKVLLDIADVEKAIGGAVAAKIPSDLIVPRSVNRGIPVVLDAPRSRVARSFAAIAQDALGLMNEEAAYVS